MTIATMIFVRHRFRRRDQELLTRDALSRMFARNLKREQGVLVSSFSEIDEIDDDDKNEISDVRWLESCEDYSVDRAVIDFDSERQNRSSCWRNRMDPGKLESRRLSRQTPGACEASDKQVMTIEDVLDNEIFYFERWRSHLCPRSLLAGLLKIPEGTGLWPISGGEGAGL